MEEKEEVKKGVVPGCRERENEREENQIFVSFPRP